MTAVIISVVVVVLIVMGLLFAKNLPTNQESYQGKAKLIARLTDEQGCFLCQFEKDGQIINAVYGDDGPDLKVGDEVDIVWPGLYTRLPHVMNKEVYDRSMQIEATQQDNNAF